MGKCKCKQISNSTLQYVSDVILLIIHEQIAQFRAAMLPTLRYAQEQAGKWTGSKSHLA